MQLPLAPLPPATFGSRGIYMYMYDKDIIFWHPQKSKFF